jgi:DNA-binding CsgD family transcriptional regulator
MFKQVGTAGVAQKKYKAGESKGLSGNVSYDPNENYMPQIDINRLRESKGKDNLADMLTLRFMQDPLMDEITGLEILLKKVLDMAEDGILILNTNLYPVYWNSKAEKMGLSPGPEPAKSSPQDRSPSTLPPGWIEEFAKIKMSRSESDNSLNSEGQQNIFKFVGNSKFKVQIKRLVTGQPFQENSDRSFFLLTFRESGKSYRKTSTLACDENLLTLREIEVLHFIRQGLTNKEISKKLWVSLPTVATHVRHIFKKMGICSRTKLICQLESKSNRFEA